MQNFPQKRFDLKEFLAKKGKAKPQHPSYRKFAPAAKAQVANDADGTDQTASDTGA